jgi:hypothetical protein
LELDLRTDYEKSDILIQSILNISIALRSESVMQRFFAFIPTIVFCGISLFSTVALTQDAPAAHAVDAPKTDAADSALKDFFEAKIKVEWEALKNRDKKAYGELLADEYQGVEIDGQGERNKLQAIGELANQNVFNYTLWGLKVTPLGPDATFVVYESTMQFPPNAQVRLLRVYIGELWVKRDGQWKELHYQETKVK